MIKYDGFCLGGRAYCWGIDKNNETWPVKINEKTKTIKKGDGLYIIIEGKEKYIG
jgi:hypothetical protein